MNSVPSPLLIRAGGPVTGGFVGATDNVIVGISGTDVETNFEPGDGNVVINTSNAAARGFAFVNEGANGSGSFVGGPSGSDGSGSAKLTVDQTGGEALVNGLYAGTRLDHLSFLSYKTYQAAATHATTLQLDADYDATDNTTQFQGRIVFEPQLAGAAPITNEIWQTWNPLTTPSGWWQTGTPRVGGNVVAQACTQGSPCSFTQLLAALSGRGDPSHHRAERWATDRRRDLAQGRERLGELHRQHRLADHGGQRRCSQRHRDLRLRAVNRPGEIHGRRVLGRGGRFAQGVARPAGPDLGGSTSVRRSWDDDLAWSTKTVGRSRSRSPLRSRTCRAARE